MQVLTADRCKRPRGRHYQTALRLFYGIITKIAARRRAPSCKERAGKLMKFRCIASRNARIYRDLAFSCSLINSDTPPVRRVSVYRDTYVRM